MVASRYRSHISSICHTVGFRNTNLVAHIVVFVGNHSFVVTMKKMTKWRGHESTWRSNDILSYVLMFLFVVALLEECRCLWSKSVICSYDEEDERPSRESGEDVNRRGDAWHAASALQNVCDVPWIPGPIRVLSTFSPLPFIFFSDICCSAVRIQ